MPTPESKTRARGMLRHLRRIAVAFVGGIVVAVGLAMLVLPGPAVLVVPAGLAILATEFHWAQRLLQHVHRLVASGCGLFKRREPTRPEARRTS